jgi:hypothetical protein
MFPLLAVLLVQGCARGTESPGGREQSAAAKAPAAAADPKDPCTLVSRAEAEQLIGHLRSDPYRIGGDSKPSPTSSTCYYQADDGRNFTIDVSFEGGKVAMAAIGLVTPLIDQAFKQNASAVDTSDVDWDEARWQWPGSLHVLKGDAFLDIDTGGSRTGMAGAVRLAGFAVKRLDARLPYNSGPATAQAPGPLVEPRDPCSLIPRAEIEALLGPLSGEPRSDPRQTECVYEPVKHPPLTKEVRVTVAWHDGFKQFEQSKAILGTVTAGLGVDKMALAKGTVGGSDTGVKLEKVDATPAKDPEFGKMMGKMKGLLSKIGGTPEMSASGGLVTDTLVTGPWDEGAILAGLNFEVVKKDVMISIGIGLLGLEQVKKLAAVAVSRL